MDAATLKTLILSQPDGSPIRLAYAGRDFNRCAELLNAKTERGLITIRELSSYCVTQGITGAVLAVDTIPIGAEIMPGVSMTLQIKGLLKTIVTLIQDDYRLEEVDVDSAAFDMAVGGLKQLGLISDEQIAGLKAMADGRASLVESAFGPGATVTGSQILSAEGGE